jgi:8-oxo-dGTP pyrophosphatase MutT (NUDIX family)
MTQLLYGERIGRAHTLRIGASAVIFDHSRDKVLLTRRSDNSRWCLPGGAMEAGETIVECCEREVLEETGLRASVRRLVGIYTTPNRVLAYADGNSFQLVAFSFEAEIISGELSVTTETTAYGYFSKEEIARMDVMEHHNERIDDAFADQAAAFLR